MNIEVALRERGASMRDIVRIRYVIRDNTEWQDCRYVVRRWLGSVRPAQSVIQANPMDEHCRIEIEVTARKTGMGHNYAD